MEARDADISNMVVTEGVIPVGSMVSVPCGGRGGGGGGIGKGGGIRRELNMEN